MDASRPNTAVALPGSGGPHIRAASKCQMGGCVTERTTDEGGPEMNATTYAIDLAKSVFQLYWVEPGTGEINCKKLTRAKLTSFLSTREPANVAMEACGSAHHWARVLSQMGAPSATAAPAQGA